MAYRRNNWGIKTEIVKLWKIRNAELHQHSLLGNLFKDLPSDPQNPQKLKRGSSAKQQSICMQPTHLLLCARNHLKIYLQYWIQCKCHVNACTVWFRKEQQGKPVPAQRGCFINYFPLKLIESVGVGQLWGANGAIKISPEEFISHKLDWGPLKPGKEGHHQSPAVALRHP